MKTETVVKSFEYLGWQHMVGAVLDVFHENQQKDDCGQSKYKASADTWCFSEDLRKILHQQARKYWCDRTDMDVTYFPMSVDFVARLYFRIRKRTAEEVDAFNDAVAEASGVAVQHASLFDTLESQP